MVRAHAGRQEDRSRLNGVTDGARCGFDRNRIGPRGPSGRGSGAVIDSYNGQGGAGHEDQAPDTGLWSYTVNTSTTTTTTPPPLQLSVVKLVAPKTATAGKAYVVVLFVKRSDTGDLLGIEGTVRCSARAAGHAVPARGAIVSLSLSGQKVSALSCMMTAPTKARGKLLAGSINASYQGVHVTRNFTAKIK